MSPAIKQAELNGKIPNTDHKVPKLNAMTLFAFRVIIWWIYNFYRMMIWHQLFQTVSRHSITNIALKMELIINILSAMEITNKLNNGALTLLINGYHISRPNTPSHSKEGQVPHPHKPPSRTITATGEMSWKGNNPN